MNYFKKRAAEVGSSEPAAERGPVICFDVHEIQGKGSTSRQLVLSDNGITVQKPNGGSTVWKSNSEDFLSVKLSKTDETHFIISVVQHHHFEAADARQVERILDAFRGLNFHSPHEHTQMSSTDQAPASLPNTKADTKLKKQYCINDFEEVCVIGKGSFGKVVLVRRRCDNVMLAMKIVALGSSNDIFVREEERILREIDSPFLVKMLGSFEENNSLHMLMEYEDKGDLRQHLQRVGKFPEHIVYFIAAEAILALESLHRQSIVYRDIKPENILISSLGHVKLIDMGLAKQGISSSGGQAAQGYKTQTFCGTPQYQAPEILKGDEYGFAVDWWSLGILVYELLTGSVPFDSNNRHDLYKNAINAEIKIPSYLSKEAASFLRGVLVRRPEDRLGSGPLGVFEIQSHPFFRNISWSRLQQKKAPSPVSFHSGSLFKAEVNDPEIFSFSAHLNVSLQTKKFLPHIKCNSVSHFCRSASSKQEGTFSLDPGILDDSSLSRHSTVDSFINLAENEQSDSNNLLDSVLSSYLPMEPDHDTIDSNRAK